MIMMVHLGLQLGVTEAQKESQSSVKKTLQIYSKDL